MFTVYRERKTEIFGEKYLGVFEAPLFSYLANSPFFIIVIIIVLTAQVDCIPHELDTRHCITSEKGMVTVDLEVDTSGKGSAYDGNLHNAAQKLLNVHARPKRSHSPRPSTAGAGAILGQALDYLDHIVHAVDGLVEVGELACSVT